MSLYRVCSPPLNEIEVYRQESDSISIPSSPTYGLDAPLGLLASNIFAPLYLYATLRGKFQVWQRILNDISKQIDLCEPCLDCGCGRGMVLIQIAHLKKEFTHNCSYRSVLPVYGVDIFNSFDQTSNSPLSTYRNVASANLLDYIVVHTANFVNLPFKDNSFSLVTSSLAIHNVNNRQDKQRAIQQCARVTKPNGWLISVDLKGNVAFYQQILRELHWQTIERYWAGIQMMFGLWPCEILKAQKPQQLSDSFHSNQTN